MTVSLIDNASVSNNIQHNYTIDTKRSQFDFFLFKTMSAFLTITFEGNVIEEHVTVNQP